ncbi:metal-dependent hydrolase [Halogeometricum limi]|uniref:LexA-binding, inner membrane-associated putative hydrolase n=1 Tax=Halogeometricum limi TaxID=555875 RepID=A0A1I6IJN0_9EURY|nr:metal-dependent hydrolase [Halogeometricum limi]SFR66891.1 LexA-binding, inner membrane-associated putative hydrolase [Halogeometricum limi]
MWPHGHLSVGYILYSAYTRVQLDRPPEWPAMFLILVGTQLPDLIDKPLWLLGILPSGRALGHSLLFAVPLAVLVTLALRRVFDAHWLGVAFGIGYVSALLGDGALFLIQGTLTRDLVEISFWFWPFNLPAGQIVDALGVTPGIAAAIAQKSAWTAANLPDGAPLRLWIRSFELAATVVAVLMWMYDGMPGVDTLRRLYSNR